MAEDKPIPSLDELEKGTQKVPSLDELEGVKKKGTSESTSSGDQSVSKSQESVSIGDPVKYLESLPKPETPVTPEQTVKTHQDLENAKPVKNPNWITGVLQGGAAEFDKGTLTFKGL